MPADIQPHVGHGRLAQGAHWARRLGQLWWHRQGLKVAGICAFTALFFQGYFFVLHRPSRPPTVMPLTMLDGWVGFEPRALWLYVSLWVYVGVAPALLGSLRALLGYGAWAAALCLAGLACFWLWPTAVPYAVHVAAAGDGLEAAGFALMRGVDASGNACPSLHVATAVFTAAWVAAVLRHVGAPRWAHAINATWVLLIAWSTVAVRQHVVLDVLAGALLGAGFAAASLRWGPAPGAGPVPQGLSSKRLGMTRS